MKKTKKKLWMILGLSALIVAGTTLAIWHQNIQKTNNLKADSMKATVTEKYTPSTPDSTVTKEVSFKNDGTTDAFLRVAYVENWQKEDAEGNSVLLSNKANGTEVAVKNWTKSFSDYWQDGKDGWFYYKYVLQSGESTEKILNSVTFPDYRQEAYKSYADADYSLYFKVEMLQASTGDATLNKDKVNEEASKTVFGKSATVDYVYKTVTWK
ncbi:BsaA family SipW-dependent biofilm matrix protein [Blautia sp. JLR.GB0024]|uniref:BsaA family SipW-dependent biofilm matrix protein n=1 Tax=Blautia sp. JLR.GB0024 TaxID=3123295 RepID=UPI0030055F0A